MGIIIDSLKSKQLTQFQESTNFNVFLEVLGGQLEDIQDVIDDMIVNFNLEKAFGTTLDNFGILVGAPKRLVGMSDLTYRNVCMAQVLINTYKGTQEELLAFFRTLGATDIKYREYGKAAVRIQYTGLTPEDFPPSLILQTVRYGTHPITFDISYYTEKPFGFLGNPEAYGLNDGELGTR